MKLIEIATVAKKYAEHLAVFFTGDGLIIKADHFSFLLPLASTIAQYGLTLKSAHWSVWNEDLQFCNRCAAPLQKVVATTEKNVPAVINLFFQHFPLQYSCSFSEEIKFY